MLIWSSGRCWGVDVDNAVAGNIVFPAGVFTHSPLRRHLTAQQQDKADEERGANYRRRSQRREILQQGVLLSCRLGIGASHQARCATPPRMCLTQVPKMLVLLS